MAEHKKLAAGLVLALAGLLAVSLPFPAQAQGCGGHDYGYGGQYPGYTTGYDQGSVYYPSTVISPSYTPYGQVIPWPDNRVLSGTAIPYAGNYLPSPWPGRTWYGPGW